jgi:hypothetical protein
VEASGGELLFIYGSLMSDSVLMSLLQRTPTAQVSKNIYRYCFFFQEKLYLKKMSDGVALLTSLLQRTPTAQVYFI